MPSVSPSYQVRAVRCDYRADDEAVYQALCRATEPLSRVWQRLGLARRVALKFNQDKAPQRQGRVAGQLQQLVSEKVARAVLRLLRERLRAELVCVDVSYYAMYEGTRFEDTETLLPLLREFGVEFVDGTQPPYRRCPVPGGGRMFASYLLPEAAVAADETISVAKLKNHAFMGITLSLKNLFGLMPGEPHGHGRHYYHHLVRMPYMLADLGRVFDPALCIVDGLVGQAGQEWGDGGEHGPPRIADVLLAGDHPVATDACGARLMGHDPGRDWLAPPFHRDRNALLVAAEGGYGTVDPAAIDFANEAEAPGDPVAFRAAREVRRSRLKPVVSDERAHDETLRSSENDLCLLRFLDVDLPSVAGGIIQRPLRDAPVDADQ